MDLKEFERLVKTLQPNVVSHVVEVLFVKFDHNNDRSITLKEFRTKIFG
jgi:Ca2+-binding EF-hand superfamily protein